MSTYQLDPDIGRIALPVRVTGRARSQVIDMVLDTGASITMLSHDVALTIGCDPAKATRRIEIITASSIEVVPLIIIPTAEVLGQEVKDLEAICHDLPGVSIVDGLLGLNFLRHFDLHLNFRSTRTLELTR